MTAKEFLSEAYHVDQRINSKLELVQSLRDMATKATSTLSDAPRSSSPNAHRMEDIIVKMIDLENEINADIDALVDLKRNIMLAIEEVKNVDYRTLLEQRYLCFKSWAEIAENLRYSKDHVFTLHRKALSAIKVNS